MPGKVVVLNGPSSAGKTTLSQAVRELVGLRCAAVPIDRLFSMAHPKRALDWEVYAALTEATFGAAAGFANAGFDVIVDIVFERRTCFDVAERALGPFNRAYVAITCDVDELERREQARGNRPPGLARRQRDTVLHDLDYALRLDTTATPVTECAAQIARLFRA